MTALSQIAVRLDAPDPIYRARVVSLLRPRPEITLVDDTAGPTVDAQVALIVRDAVEEATLRVLRDIKHASTARSVLVVAVIDEPKLIDAAECGPCRSRASRRRDAGPTPPGHHDGRSG
ncbi:hypothetical protein ACFW96_28795 [Streptomyces gardneri]|uniref:hypothetical protein n=1 Tax=Streptomyces gardneri TaxID=66892 RepID=UPI00367FB959